MLLAKRHKVRARVRREDERAEDLRRLGAEVMLGDLSDLASMHRAIDGCSRVYFGMSISANYLEATVNVAAVARHHGVEAFVNMSQMTVTEMNITQTTNSPQHKLHWLAEQVLAWWSGLPVVTMRPTVFLEGFFLRLADAGVRDRDELVLPLGSRRTSPIARLVGHSDVGLTPTADLNCVHVFERTRREMGTGGNIESAACSWRELAGLVAALLCGERLAQKLRFAG
jgi:uncharacterized protein YbjT (DUF2867 family)